MILCQWAILPKNLNRSQLLQCQIVGGCQAGQKKTLSTSTAGKTADFLRMGGKALFVDLVATSYSIIYTPVPQSWTTASTCCRIVRAAVCGAAEGWPPGTPGVATPRAASQPASLLLSPIWPPHISHPSMSPRAYRPPAAASHVTMQPGLDGCCSESRESPIWTAADSKESQDEDAEKDSRCILYRKWLPST